MLVHRSWVLNPDNKYCLKRALANVHVPSDFRRVGRVFGKPRLTPGVFLSYNVNVRLLGRIFHLRQFGNT